MVIIIVVFHVTNSSQLTRVMITRREGEREPKSGGRSGKCVIGRAQRRGCRLAGHCD